MSNLNGRSGRDGSIRHAREAELSLKRLKPRIADAWERLDAAPEVRHDFATRLDRYWGELFDLLFGLYGDRYDFFYHLEEITLTAVRAAAERPEPLRELDRRHVNEPDWFCSERFVGGALYVDLFGDNLANLKSLVGYFQDLGLTYVHLMPLFAVRPGDNDGGYAISNYRSVDPRLGTIEDLRELAATFREAGIELVLDFVFNHTADDHEWAARAQAGEAEYQDFYFTFPDREVPDRYERTLREIFPTVRRGNFTWHDGMGRWVWTTFNSFQWDLNYHNPAVFRSMLEEMFFIASTGIGVLRLDAVAFIWKEMGTNCENRPEAHDLIRAFNRLARIATPSLLFKSEAIVHPDEVVRYIGPEECQISYNPTLMALLWESLATREVRLLAKSLLGRHKLPAKTAWVNYLRCHDDIGWTFDDGDAAAIGINAFGHRQFLNNFYTGQFEGSFARGVPFQENPDTGDMRIAGTLASLAGLERAIELDDDDEKDLAVRRMLLLHGVALSVGGIPLIYLGEEWGQLNDYEFAKDPAKAGDTRWVHRPKMRWEFLESLDEGLTTAEGSIRARIFRSLRRLIALRKAEPAFGGQEMDLLGTENPHVLGFVRRREGHRVIVVANFSEKDQVVAGNRVRTAGLGHHFDDLVADRPYATVDPLTLVPYQIAWLRRA